MIGPADQSVLGPAAKVQSESAERTFGDLIPRDPGPVLQPESGRSSGELGVKCGGSLPGIDGAGLLRHHGATVEVLAVAEKCGPGLWQAVNDGPVHRSRSGQGGQQAAVKAVYPERVGVEKALAEDLGDANTQHSLDLRLTQRTRRFGRLEGRHLHDGDAAKVVRPGRTPCGTAQGVVVERQDEAGLPAPVA
jgi:hypothetical protein